MRSRVTREISRQRGFNIIELVITMVIATVLAAMTVPAIFRTLHNVQLNGAATNIANIIGRTRYEAIKANTSISCAQTTVGGLTAIYVDLNGNGSLDTGEPVATLPGQIQFAPSGAPTSGTGFPSTTVATSSTVLKFDQRGIPTFTNYYEYDLGFTGSADGYRAVIVTPMGKTKIWRGIGGNWVYP